VTCKKRVHAITVPKCDHFEVVKEILSAKFEDHEEEIFFKQWVTTDQTELTTQCLPVSEYIKKLVKTFQMMYGTCELVWKNKSYKQSKMVLLRSEILSGMSAKRHTVATSNNRDHLTRSLSSATLASTINCSPGSQALLEVTHQDHSIGITLLLLVHATYIYFCSSRTSRSW